MRCTDEELQAIVKLGGEGGLDLKGLKTVHRAVFHKSGRGRKSAAYKKALQNVEV